MSLELGTRFYLRDGTLVEVVPDIERILGMKANICMRCRARFETLFCESIGCLSFPPLTKDLEVGYPRIIREVENE